MVGGLRDLHRAKALFSRMTLNFVLGLQVCSTTTQFLLHWGRNPRLCACQANALPTESQPQPWARSPPGFSGAGVPVGSKWFKGRL